MRIFLYRTYMIIMVIHDHNKEDMQDIAQQHSKDHW